MESSSELVLLPQAGQQEDAAEQTTLSSPRNDWQQRRSLFSLPFFDQPVRPSAMMCACDRQATCVCVRVPHTLCGACRPAQSAKMCAAGQMVHRQLGTSCCSSANTCTELNITGQSILSQSKAAATSAPSALPCFS